MHGAGGGGGFRRGGFVAEQGDVLQAELIPQRAEVLPDIAADDRHAAVRHPGAGARGNGGRHGLGLGLAAGGRVADDGRGVGVHRALRRVGGVGQQQVELGQDGRAGVAGVVGQRAGMYRHAGVRRHAAQRGGHHFGAAEQPHAAVAVLQAVAAQADRHVSHRQHGRQQGALGGVEGIELVDEHRPPRKKLRVQGAGRQLLAVAGVHGALLQQRFVRAVDQRQFPQLFAVGAGGFGIGCQGVRRDAGAFEFLDGLGRFFAKRRRAALPVVVDDAVQQRVDSAAHQQRAAGLVQRLHGRAAVAAQQCFGQRRERITFDIGGKGIPQGAVEQPLGGGGELFRHDEQAGLAALGPRAQLRQHLVGFAAARRAEKKMQHRGGSFPDRKRGKAIPSLI